ncbi:secreted RxLR effector protein 161-like [Vigna umbellata]|uniref:secreted RxLR effector protein 161-like n=1 Tax=Vigna umbellata TaxID=87088 RepID=UPI001F5F7CFA|nr:secreted RxLR effector protein 161-like [Vigna umbellata]
MINVCLCAKFQSDRRETHLSALKGIFRYLKRTISLDLHYKRSECFDLKGYCDADFAGDRVERKSTNEGCYFIGGNLVSWLSNKHNTIVLSIAEAEYISAAHCCSQLLWIRNLLEDYNHIQGTIPVLCDNNVAFIIEVILK